MKKIFLIIFCNLCIVIPNFAQLTFSADTSFIAINVGNLAEPTINLTNTVNSITTVNWNVDSVKCIIPTGYTVTGSCFNPFVCYGGFTNNVYSQEIPANSSAQIKMDVQVGVNARLDSSCYILVNVDTKKLVFKITAINNPSSIAANKPLRINLQMYPLPATNTLNVVHNNNKVSKAVLFNVLGKKIMEYYTPANTNGFSINTADLSDGMYIIDVRDNNNHSLATQRFTKN